MCWWREPSACGFSSLSARILAPSNGGSNHRSKRRPHQQALCQPVYVRRTRAAQQAEIVALRHQIAVRQQRAPRCLRLRQSDRLLWIWLSRFWPGWRHWLRILKPDTVIRWHRTAFARYWTRKSRRRPGRPSLAAAIRDLIQQMSQANFLWGAPRIHGELLKLGIQ